MNFLDQNADGQISLEELLQAFQAIDENQDGVISPEELQKFMEKFEKQPESGEKPEEEPNAEEHGGKKIPVANQNHLRTTNLNHPKTTAKRFYRRGIG